MKAMKVNLFLLHRITGEHVHFIFVMNFGKFVLYFCCLFWIFYSSLKGEFHIFSLGVFSSYNGPVSVSHFRFVGNETSGFNDICRCKLRTKQALLVTMELKLNDGKEKLPANNT